MKKILLTALVMLLCKFSFCQAGNQQYDKLLADSLGADEYGMKYYVLVILKTGTVTIEKKEITDSLFAGHLANIGRLARDGKLVVAGPLKKNENDYRGIFILNANTKEEANVLLATDPAISAGLLTSELFEWYGSAALPLYLPHHDKIQRSKF